MGLRGAGGVLGYRGKEDLAIGLGGAGISNDPVLNIESFGFRDGKEKHIFSQRKRDLSALAKVPQLEVGRAGAALDSLDSLLPIGPWLSTLL